MFILKKTTEDGFQYSILGKKFSVTFRAENPHFETEFLECGKDRSPFEDEFAFIYGDENETQNIFFPCKTGVVYEIYQEGNLIERIRVATSIEEKNQMANDMLRKMNLL